MTTEEKIRPVLQHVIEIIRYNCFVQEYKDRASDEECLGRALQNYFEWDARIITACAEALSDANLHPKAAAAIGRSHV